MVSISIQCHGLLYHILVKKEIYSFLIIALIVNWGVRYKFYWKAKWWVTMPHESECEFE